MELPICNPNISNLSDVAYAEARLRLDKEKLTDAEVDKLYDIVEVTAGLLDQHAIRYTIEGGSLLGAVRNGGLIKYDNDADFNVLQDDLAKIKTLWNHFAEYGLVCIDTPGWGLQIAHADSPSLEPGLWTDGISQWTSKWPFLDLIAIQWDKTKGAYVYAEDVAHHDYPDYFLTKSDWENPFEKVQFGHLQLWAIGGVENRQAYLDRHFKDWDKIIEVNMDHRANKYFKKRIKLPLLPQDRDYRPRSNNPTTLKKPWPRSAPLTTVVPN